VGATQRPLHLLFVDEPSTHHLIDRRLHEGRADRFLCRRRSPKFGMNSRLLRMYVSNSLRLSTTFFAAGERA
jgi:hypothetical protein